MQTFNSAPFTPVQPAPPRPLLFYIAVALLAAVGLIVGTAGSVRAGEALVGAPAKASLSGIAPASAPAPLVRSSSLAPCGTGYSVVSSSN